jgi:hypothetical protein
MQAAQLRLDTGFWGRLALFSPFCQPLRHQNMAGLNQGQCGATT